MKNLILILLCFFTSSISLSQDLINDTVRSNIVVEFNKVKNGSDKSFAKMFTSFKRNSDSVILKFEVPSILYRSNSSLNDFCVIKLPNKVIKLQNKAEYEASGILNDIYTFDFHISKTDLINILSKGFKMVMFYFTPNENVEKKYLIRGDKLNPVEKLFLKLPKITLKSKVKKPNKKKIEELLFWLKR